MQLFLDCYPCLLRQVLQAARIASTDEATQARIMDEAMLTLTQHHTFTTAPALAQTMHEIVQRHSGLTDPYQQIKARDMRAALRLEPFLTAFVDAGPDRLSRSLKLAATGNVMDSALYSNLDIESCVAAELDKPFARFDLEAFEAELVGVRTVLIVGDNAGEAVFDKVLARELAKTHEVIFAVRGRPIINDVTADDAHLVGIDAHARILSTGCAAPGAILDACSDEFRSVFARADLVISKGQGNFEALSDAPRTLFFLLKAKCSKVAQELDVEVGDFVFVAGPGPA
ncbi:MAG TPA: DUF89 family protein [Propionibacterium sp.]|nr:DUF89 family protein [Propionibacterium sp.]